MSESKYIGLEKNYRPKKLVAVRGAKNLLPNKNLAGTNEGHVVADSSVAPEALVKELEELAKYPIPIKTRR